MSKNLVFIVAYNHESKIEKVVARIPEEIIANPDNEVLIIDDGSRDRTFFQSESIRKKHRGKAKVTVLRNPVNQGYGGNQKLGYRYAIDHGFDRVFLIHGDGQYAPELLTEFLAEYAKSPAPDAVFGTRMAGGFSALKGGMPLYKFIGNKILTTVQNKILSSSFSEFHSGYRSYSTALLRKIPFEVNSNDFHFDTEIIIQCLAVKAKIIEIPIPTFYGDEICHVNGMQYARNVILASLRYSLGQMGFLYDRKYDLKNQRYPRANSPFSAHQRIADKVPAFSRTLLIGCEGGLMAQRLVAKGCIVDGVDSVPLEEVQVALHQYHRINLATELERLADVLKNNSYDYILLVDVLERMVEPERLLDFIRTEKAPRPRPTVIASTSNVAFIVLRAMLALGQFNYGVRGILDRHHTRLFTKQSFVRIFEQCGFAVDEISGVTLPLSIVFGEKSNVGMKLEAAADFLARNWPGATAHQLIISAKPLPTTNQLLELSEGHSHDLRSHAQDLAEADADADETSESPASSDSDESQVVH